MCKSDLIWNYLQLLSKTLATIDDDKWVCQLAAEATRYLATYNNTLEEKVSAFNGYVSPTNQEWADISVWLQTFFSTYIKWTDIDQCFVEFLSCHSKS